MKEAITIAVVLMLAFTFGAMLAIIQTGNEVENKRVNIEACKMIDELCNGRGGSYDGKNLNCY